MIFWRKKKNQSEQEQEVRDDQLLHPEGEPELEPPVEYDADLDKQALHEIEPTESQIIDDLRVDPVPQKEILPSAPVENPDDGGWFTSLRQGLSKTSTKLSGGLADLFGGRKLDADTLQELEDTLIMADVGPKAAARIVAELAERAKALEEVTPEALFQTLEDIVTESLEEAVDPLNIKAMEEGPRVVLVCGVNGVGKTTTIGKLAYQLHYRQKRNITLAAGDTFRAAALEQLEVWADRVGCDLVKKEIGSDPAAVAYEAYEVAKQNGSDILIIDTAGRLHNKSNLMAELEKIVRVLRKHDETVPHEVILVLDATTGQNAVSQVETFLEIADVSGLVVTKLDGSAKGGVLLALVEKFALPVYAIGVGEQIDDLQPFRAREYAQALLGR